MRLEDVGAGGLGRRIRRLPECAEQGSVLVEDENVGGKRVRAQPFRLPERFVIAAAGQPVPGLQDKDLEVFPAAEEGDPGREIQTGLEDLDLESGRHDDVLAAGLVELHVLAWTERVFYCLYGRLCSRLRRHHSLREDY